MSSFTRRSASFKARFISAKPPHQQQITVRSKQGHRWPWCV